MTTESPSTPPSPTAPGAFKDHFSGHAAAYAANRPGYPPALFATLAELPRTRRVALDCATGNGQAAIGLAAWFPRVVAIDASAEQLARAVPHEHVEYRRARAEASGMADASVDLVTAAQAVHWFDFDAFYAEVRRVLAPGGAVALFTYNLVRVSPEVNRLIDRLAYQLVGPWWPPERRWVDEEYRTLPFPFAEVRLPPTEFAAEWDVGRLLAYIDTWSACQRYRQETGRDPVKMIQDELIAAWGAVAGQARRVAWPIFIRAGHLPGR